MHGRGVRGGRVSGTGWAVYAVQVDELGWEKRNVIIMEGGKTHGLGNELTRGRNQGPRRSHDPPSVPLIMVMADIRWYGSNFLS